MMFLVIILPHKRVRGSGNAGALLSEAETKTRKTQSQTDPCQNDYINELEMCLP